MWQNIISLIVVFVALFFIGRKLYRLLRNAADPSKNISCGSGCSGCNSDSCDNRTEEHHE